MCFIALFHTATNNTRYTKNTNNTKNNKNTNNTKKQ